MRPLNAALAPALPPAAALLLALLPLGLAGCPGKTDNGENGGDTDTADDSGDTSVHYDEGCILVDGAGGYAHLQDAVSVASDGSTITLCAGTYEEAVLVDKTVTITGDAEDQVFLVGQGTDPALRITAPDVVVQSLTVESQYSGIIVESGGSGTTVADVTFDAPAYWAFQGTNATGLTLRNSSILGAQGGAVQISGGSATVSDNVIQDAQAFAVQITNGADVTLTGNTITNVIMLSDDVSDGMAVEVLDGSLTTNANSISGVQGIAFYAENSDITLVDDTVDAVDYLGAFLLDSTVDGQGVDLTGALLQGVYLSGPSVRWVDSTISVVPEESGSYNYNRWGNNGNPWYGGLFVAADAAELSRTTVAGYNNYGVYVVPYTKGATAKVTSEDLVADNTGRWGMWFVGTDTTASGLIVRNLREPELATPCTEDGSTYNVDYSVSLLVSSGSLTLTGGTFADNQGWGITNYQASVSIDDTIFDGNACSGIINFAGVAELTNNTFTHGSRLGGLWDYTGTSVLTGNTFTENHSGAVFGPYDAGTYTYEYHYYNGYGLDIQASSSDMTVEGNVFNEGDQGIYLYDTDAVLTNNAWTGYDNAAVTVSSPPSGRAVHIEDCSFDQQGTYAVQAYYGDVELEDVSFGTATTTTISYDYYQDGKLVFNSTYSTYASAFYVYGSADTPASLSIDGLIAENPDYGLASVYNAEIDFNDVSVGTFGSSSGSNLIYGYYSGVTPIITIDGLEVTEAHGTPLSLSMYSAGAAYVNLSNLQFGAVTGTSVSASGFDAITLTDSDLGTPTGYGLYAYTTQVGKTVTSVSNVTVTDAGSEGLYFRGGIVELTGSTATSGTRSGVKFESTTVRDASANTATFNDRYGFECSGATVEACSDNVLSDNLMGEQYLCSASCTEPAGDGS